MNWLTLVSLELNDPAAAVRYAQEYDDLVRTDWGNPAGGKDLLALALHKKGEIGRSKELLEQMGQDVQRMGVIGQRCRFHYAEALIAMDDGKFGQAVENFQRVFQLLPPNHAPQIAYGIALLKTGRVDEAVEELSRVCRWVLNTDVMIGMLFLPEKLEWPIAAVKAHYWLGVAYEQQGRRADAAKEYRTFLDTWKDADFSSPLIKDAKVRLSRLI